MFHRTKTIAASVLALLLGACGSQGTTYVPSSTQSAMRAGSKSSDAVNGRVVEKPNSGAFTVASGRVVADPSGEPMAGVAVNLYLWTPCTVVRKSGLRNFVCPKPVATTKTGGDGTFRLRARSGHYLLAIGSDDPTDIVHPTIHDNVTLAGASQRLLAPGPCPGTPPQLVGPHCMPTFPLVSPTVPEKNGDYRLVTLIRDEYTCAQEFDVLRTGLGLEAPVVDEWLTENTRTLLAWRTNPKAQSLPVNPRLSSGQIESVGGDAKPVDGVSACAYYLIKDGVFTSSYPEIEKYALDPRTHWISARRNMVKPPHDPRQGVGFAEYPRDPRNFQDPAVKYWP